MSGLKCSCPAALTAAISAGAAASPRTRKSTSQVNSAVKPIGLSPPPVHWRIGSEPPKMFFVA